MESKQHTPSVIARLMGLDELPPQRHVNKQRRVLSEDYFRKIASIRLMEEQSYCGRSLQENCGKRKISKELFGVPEKLEISELRKMNANSNRTEAKLEFIELKRTDVKHFLMDKKLHSASLYGKNEICSDSGRTMRGIVLRSLQKLEFDHGSDSFRELGLDYPHKLIETQFSPRKIVVLKPNSVVARSSSRASLSPSSPEDSKLGYAKGNQFIKAKPVESHGELVRRKNLANVLGLKHSFRFSREFANKSSRETRQRHGSSSENETSCSPPPSDRPSSAIEAKNGFSGKKSAEMSHEVRVACKGSTLEMRAIPIHDTMLRRNLNGKLDKSEHSSNFNLQSGEVELDSSFGNRSRGSTRPGNSKAGGEKSESCSWFDSERNNTIQEICLVQDEMESKHFARGVSDENYVPSKLPSLSVPCEDLAYNHYVQETQVTQDELKKSYGENDLFGYHENEDLETSPHISEASVSQESSVRSPEGALVQRESSVRSPEEALVHSKCHISDFELPLSFGDGYSPSPNSVLEPPFIEEAYSSECSGSFSSDIHGLRKQLQLLQSDLEASYSEGSEMMVSSDEDSGEEAFDLSKERRNLLGWFRAEESRELSYLVEVLDEAGFHDGNLETCSFRTWHSPEFPICPSVFEILEKQFGKQMSWERSERRLLFDRINLGLKEIFEPCGEKLLGRRLKLNRSWNREVIEDELWILLINQEKEVSKGLSEKALREEFRWSEFVDVIGREIERFLFDELVAELEY